MAVYNEPRSVAGLTAGSDLSAEQFKFMEVAAGDTVAICGVNGICIGVLGNNPIEGVNAEIHGIGGGSMIKLAAAVALGELITSDANGEGIVATGAGTRVLAIPLQAGADNDIIPVTLVTYNLHA